MIGQVQNVKAGAGPGDGKSAPPRYRLSHNRTDARQSRLRYSLRWHVYRALNPAGFAARDEEAELDDQLSHLNRRYAPLSRGAGAEQRSSVPLSDAGQSQLQDADVQIKSLVPGLRFFNNKTLLIM